jgi:hypothetical protein
MSTKCMKSWLRDLQEYVEVSMATISEAYSSQIQRNLAASIFYMDEAALNLKVAADAYEDALRDNEIEEEAACQ